MLRAGAARYFQRGCTSGSAGETTSQNSATCRGCRRGHRMKRRDFVAMIGGAAAGWPLAVQAQQRDRLRRLGVLMARANNPISQTLTAAFLQGLGALNWHEGGDLRIDWRWAGGDLALFERYAGELVALDPDVLVANGSKDAEAL